MFGSDETYPVRPVKRNGEIVLMHEELMKKLDEEQEAWHWKPWLRTRLEVVDGILRELECLTRDSIESFPDGLFDGEFQILFKTFFILIIESFVQ